MTSAAPAHRSCGPAGRLPGTPGCCGLAGNFGFQVGHGEVSEACAERALLPRLREAAPGAVVLADGFRKALPTVLVVGPAWQPY